jgi:hypothetical protein
MGYAVSQVLKLALDHDVPVLHAGDLFDRWNSPPELINWALELFREWGAAIYTVPGQHDLPEHSYVNINRSAFQTLVEAGAVKDATGGMRIPKGSDFVLRGIPWGCEVKPLKGECRGLKILLVHSYCWLDEPSYPGAPSKARLCNRAGQLEGYDVAVFGDNHQAFAATSGSCRVVNCGTLMRRRTDEIDYKPSAWLLRADKTVERVELDVSEDRWVEKVPESWSGSSMSESLAEALGEMKDLDRDELDFRAAVLRCLDDNKVGEETRMVILEAMEE